MDAQVGQVGNSQAEDARFVHIVQFKWLAATGALGIRTGEPLSGRLSGDRCRLEVLQRQAWSPSVRSACNSCAHTRDC